MNSQTIRKLSGSFVQLHSLNKSVVRRYATRKRFYRKTSILQSNTNFEITLDQRKLKTPSGQPFIVHSEPLALAIASEWDSQKEKIQQSSMHLTALCSTAIDNPNKLTKLDIVQYITNYLPTDAVLFQSSDNDDLYKLQLQEWDPIIDWFNKRYNVEISKSRSIESPVVNEEVRSCIHRHLMSYNFESLIGFMFAVDSVKSVILTLACADMFITPQKAVLLSRLEEEYQLNYWGRVEWAHELSQQDLQARMSAAIMFIQLNSSSTLTKSKNIT